MSEAPEGHPPSRRRVALVVLFHSTCAILSTILSKSALNGIDAPVTLLAFQTTVQVVLLTTIGYFTKWITLSRPVSVCSCRDKWHCSCLSVPRSSRDYRGTDDIDATPRIRVTATNMEWHLL